MFPRAFDYVHLRSMLVSLNDVPAMIKKAYDHMNPGGWIEFQDSTWELHSPDNTLEGTGMQRWSQNVLRGLARSGRDTVPNLAALKEHLLGAGFVDVEEKTFPVPGNGWMRRDPKMKALGMFTSGIIMHALESYRKIIGIAGLTDGEIDTLIDEARPDVANTRIHYFFRMYVDNARGLVVWPARQCMLTNLQTLRIRPEARAGQGAGQGTPRLWVAAVDKT